MYVLPRFSDNLPGRVKATDEASNPDDDVVRMGTERFAIPELLFRPSDLGEPLSSPYLEMSVTDLEHQTSLVTGLAQAGLAHTIANAISATPEDIQGLFWANIGLIGGNSKFPGFKERL